MLLGDPPLFPRQQEVELSWKILDPILDHWSRHGAPEPYPSGSWGPPSAERHDGARRQGLAAAVRRNA